VNAPAPLDNDGLPMTAEMVEVLKSIARIEVKLDTVANLNNRVRILELAVFSAWATIVGGALGLGPFA
jgi:hypothetical protein